MNDNPPPLSPEHVDELLSAELDGEFDAAALDLGLEPARAAELLAAADGVDARRRQLARARELLAEVPALDELTAARLRTAAVDAGAGAHDDLAGAGRRRAWMSVAGVAATLVVVLGIAAVANHNSAETTKAATGSAAASDANRSAGPATPPLLAAGAENFGTAADADALSDRVRETLRTAESKTQSGALQPTPFSTAAASNNDAFSYNRAQEKRSAAFGAPCDTAARQSIDAVSAPVLAGTATLDQTPVTVFVYRRGSVYVLVASDAGCKVVAHRVLGP